MARHSMHLAALMWAGALTAPAQQPASWEEITASVNRLVRHIGSREAAVCELRAALLWGGYDIRVFLTEAVTTDGKLHILRLTKGVLSDEVVASFPLFSGAISVSRDGIITIPSKEAAFNKGVPLFVSDPVLVDPKSVKVTLEWNTATATEDRGPAYPVAQTEGYGSRDFTSRAAVPFSTTPLTQTVSLLFPELSPASKYYHLGFVTRREPYDTSRPPSPPAPPLSCPASNELDLVALITPSPSFTAAGVLNVASYRGGAVAPGALITIFGSRMGADQLTTLKLTADGKKVETTIANARVLLDGVAAPMIFVKADQLSCVAPYTLAGKTSAQIQVEYQGKRSEPVTVPVADAAPGIFTAASSGKGQGAILNEDGSFNSARRPAAPGSIVVIYATGEGAVDPPVQDGQVTAPPLSKPKLPVSVKIGGLDAEVIYAGPAPGLVAGVLQVNARINTATPVGDVVPVLISVGTFTSQPEVTLAVR